MPRFGVKVDISKFVAARLELEQKQLPFVTAKALTATVQDAQAAVRGNVRQAFKLRNNWTEQGIRIKPADKRGADGVISADVHTDTANRSTGAPDYLGRQEQGGEKVPFGGRQYIAVPTKYLRQMAPGIIPAELRPRNLLGATGGRFAAHNRKGQIALRNQVRVRGFEFFLQRLKGGDMAILGRYFTDRDAYPFYLLVSAVHVRKSGLRMQETVERIANENFGTRWDEAWRSVYSAGLKI